MTPTGYTEDALVEHRPLLGEFTLAAYSFPSCCFSDPAHPYKPSGGNH